MYSFVPAAIDSMPRQGMGIYVKYCRSATPNKIIIKRNDPTYMWLICPDRELVLVQPGNLEFSPMGENFDKYMDFNLFDDAVCNDIDLDIYMINYSAYGPDSKKSPKARRHGRNPNMNQPHILADSGGFQLYSGTKTYIDPKEVVTWYNENVDWGMVLDVPPIIRTPEYLKRSAAIQKANIDVMMANKTPNVELINIIHGENYKTRMEFLKQVDHPDINRLAFPGYRDSTVSTIADLLQIVFSKERKFEHYHVLGVYNLVKLAPIIKIANMKGVPLITSDASTPLQSAVNKLYHHQQSVFEPARRIVVGAREAYANVNVHLPCSCPVCSTLKYANILGILDKSVISSLFTIHNIYEIKRYSRMMDELARTVDDKEYRMIVKRQLGSRSPETLAALDLVSKYKDDPEGILKKYSYYFTKTPAILFQDGGLFESGREVCEIAHNTRASAVVETDEERKARFEKTLSAFETTHGITPPGKVKNKKDKEVPAKKSKKKKSLSKKEK
jgi:tRNA-guanine family transglycosylase